jgi:hypothetical protein
MYNPQIWKFTCHECGGHQLNVTHEWNILAGPESESWQEWGPLEDDHLWSYKFKEKIEQEKIEKREEEHDGRPWNFVEYTKDDSSSRPEAYEVYEPHNNIGNDKFYVNCASCDRDIEFGWEQPDRCGGIYPVEFLDFSPGKIWPEPRYLDSWHQKGWL